MSKRSTISETVNAVRILPAARRRPFWLPAPNFYMLASGIAIASFFLFWEVLRDGVDGMPWIPAGIGAGMIVLGAVFLREIVLRRFRRRYVVAEQRLDRNLDRARMAAARPSPMAKLSIEGHAEIVSRMKKKSAAAKTLMRLSDGHLEVFEFCGEYIDLVDREIANVGAGSPRLAAFRRGKEVAESIRRDHLLTWAEIETKRLTKEAQTRVTISEKIEKAQCALDVLVRALEHYPDEPALNDSRNAVDDLLCSMRISHWIEQAERAEFKGNHRRAVSHYKDALFLMARESRHVRDAEALAERINSEIDRINRLQRANSRAAKPTTDD